MTFSVPGLTCHHCQDVGDYDIYLNQPVLMHARPHRKRKNMITKGVTHVLVCAQELPLSFPKRFVYRKLKLVKKNHKRGTDGWDARED